MPSGVSQNNGTTQLVTACAFLKLYESIELIFSALIGAIFGFAIQNEQFGEVYGIVMVFGVISYLLLSLIIGFLVTWLNKNKKDQLDSFQLFIYDGFFAEKPDFTKRSWVSISGLTLLLLFIILTIYVN